MSVTEIEHNSKEHSLEISCKIFTNDFESQLKKSNTQKVDLLNPEVKNKMNVLIESYIQNHLKIAVNNNSIAKMKFIGFEQVEDAIVSYFEINGINKVNSIKIENSILYEYSDQQINLMHVTVNGNRKSYKLNNPDSQTVFNF
jgi:predicted metalloenzyme YecM